MNQKLITNSQYKQLTPSTTTLSVSSTNKQQTKASEQTNQTNITTNRSFPQTLK